MLSVICFSKDRPLQLEGYIQSLLFYSGLRPETLSILYTDSPATRYDALIRKYPRIKWVRETHFHTDLSRLVDESRGYVLLGCDDVFFIDHFDVNIPIAQLASDPELFGFSLRLGLNLHSLPELRISADVLDWDWRAAPTGHWSYPWEVSASIYRREFISSYLETNLGATNPNRFESLLAGSCQDSSSGIAAKLASFRRSKCLTLTVNRVQDEFPNEFDDSSETDISTLYRAHATGRVLDWPSFYQTESRVIHVDSRYFRTTDILTEPALVLEEYFKGAVEACKSDRRFRLRLLYWRYFIKIKETARPWVPRRVMVIMRQLLRLG
jgi:hypothetical protein